MKINISITETVFNESTTITNVDGEIVAKLYFKPDGRLHEDSWLCHSGWK